MPAFVHTKIQPQNFRFLRNPGYSVDPGGFDTCTARILWRGTQAAMFAKFAIGASATATGLAAPAGSTFYCIGPQGQSEERFGHVWAEIAWKGVLQNRQDTSLIGTVSTGDQIVGVSRSMTTRETLYPVQQGDYTILAPNPGATTVQQWLRPVTVPAPGADSGADILLKWVPWRVRYIGNVFAMAVKGITIGPKSQVQQPPIIVAATPPKYQMPMLTALGKVGLADAGNTPDPLITLAGGFGLNGAGAVGAGGWLCRNYQRSSEYAMGDKVLAFWSADYEWVERESL